MTPRLQRLVATGAAAVLALGLTACGSDDSDAEGPGTGVTVTLADKGFTESRVVAYAYADALKERGFSVDVRSLASTELAIGATERGTINMYPEYDGTLFLNVLNKDADKAPDDRAAFVKEIRNAIKSKGLSVLDPAPYNNGNEVACTEDAVSKHNIENLSALGKASPELVYSANAEHLTRPDGLRLLQRDYGVRFKDTVSVDISLRYKPIEDGKADCVYAFGTDPQLATLPLTLIEDDKGAFSGKIPFRTLPVVNTKWLEGLEEEQRTAFTETLNAVNEGLTQDRIQQMNADVDIKRMDPEEVAEEFVDELDLD